MVYKHRVFLITRDGEKEVTSFRTRSPFCKSAFGRFRAIAQALDSIQDVPILTPAKFVKDATIAGGHYRLQNGDVLELR